MKKYIIYIMLIILASSVYSANYYKSFKEYEDTGYIRLIYNDSFNTTTTTGLDIWNKWEYKNFNNTLWQLNAPSSSESYNVSSAGYLYSTSSEPTATIDNLNFNYTNLNTSSARLIIFSDINLIDSSAYYFFGVGFNGSNRTQARPNYNYFGVDFESGSSRLVFSLYTASGRNDYLDTSSLVYKPNTWIRQVIQMGYNASSDSLSANVDIYNISDLTSYSAKYGVEEMLIPNASVMTKGNMSIGLGKSASVRFDNFIAFVWYPFTSFNINNCTGGAIALNVTFLDVVTKNPSVINATFQSIGDVNYSTTFSNTGSFKICVDPNKAKLNEQVTIQYTTGGTYSSYTYDTILNETKQYLTFYTQLSTSDMILTTKDRDTTQLLDGAVITMSRLVSGNWTIVEQRTTDITGRAQFGYVENIQYKFNVIKAGYNDYEFYLNPVLFSSYNVLLTSNQAQNGTQDYSGVSIYWQPSYFLNDTLNNFEFTIDSPSAGFTNYGYNLSWRGGSIKNSGTNPEGSTLTSSFLINQYQPNDVATLFYYYNNSEGVFNYQYYIPIGYTINNNSMVTINKNKDFGLNQFERVIIMTIIVIFVVGLCTLAGNLIAGMFLGLFVQAFLTYIGFIPIWYILIPFVIAMVLMQAEGR